ncbi:MAG: hypothetical protein JWM34_1409 [Ilumatobacteraceae bacterium]|nr:hypothetical protein [Ilumatobacteraceae bacterium]
MPAPRTRRRLAGGVLLAAALGAAGCASSSGVATTQSHADGSTTTGSGPVTSDSTAGTGNPGSGGNSATGDAGSLHWATCTDPKATDAVLQCATLKVPLDYGSPSGTTIDLALVRVPATGKRTGAVLFNPGGPGGSGFDSIAQGGSTISSSLGLTNFDLVGFDPRGVDRSDGVRCLTDAQQDASAYLDDTPDTPAEQQALDDSETAFSSACKAKYGDTLQFLSTTNTAKDMDAIRVAMGDSTISYLGISYGTYLGAVYATTFPHHIRALVLDSAFEPSGDTIEQQYETQLVGFEHAFDDWATWCQSHTECAFTSADVPTAWDALVAKLDANPITNSDGRMANQTVVRAATLAALYSKSDWPVLGNALQDATKGDPAGLFRLADGYSGRDDKGHYDTIQQSFTVIDCASGIEGQTPPDPAALAAKLKAAAPRFAATLSADDFDAEAQCLVMMPAQPINTLSYSGKVPIVIIGGTNDPATPFRWAQEMTKDLGPSATLVTYTGEGHGQLLASTCVTKIEAALLTELTSPKQGTTCDPDPDIAEPSWWKTIPRPAGIDAVLDSPELTAALGLGSTQVYGELHTSDLGVEDVLAAYKPELTAAGFTYVANQQPITGSDQAVYRAPNGNIFSVLALGKDAFASPDLESAASLVPTGKTLIALLYLPQ